MITENQALHSTKSLCTALGEPRSSYYRSQRPILPKTIATPCRSSPRRLTADEEEMALQVLNSERFRDTAPGEVYAVLLDEGNHICSERTMYRILARHGMTIERRQSAPRNYKKPELLATKPNELWSWDITKLKGPTKWTYYYLYKIIDVYSRNVVGWMVAHRESADLAEGLIADTILKQEIRPGQLTIHADRGSSMTSVTVGQLLADLGVTKTHSRPHVSNDNPYSESGFKTLKYRPGFPEYFGSIEDARLFCQEFFTWYNTEHRHSGIAMLTPDNVHYNQCEAILNARSNTLMNAYLDHPERFVNGMPTVEQVPKEVWINKPIVKELIKITVS
jgi:Transposase and inactivated derivatives